MLLFNQPFEVLSQFTDRRSPPVRSTLSDVIAVKGVYPAGKLDRDSEGLLQARSADLPVQVHYLQLAKNHNPQRVHRASAPNDGSNQLTHALAGALVNRQIECRRDRTMPVRGYLCLGEGCSS